MSDINIGEKITQYRKSKGLSIRELAKLADVTPSLLSQIERGLANPSVNSLKAIANALSTPLFTFFTSEVVKEDLIVRGNNRKKVILPGEDNVIYEMLTPGLGDNLEFAIMFNSLFNNSACVFDSWLIPLSNSPLFAFFPVSFESLSFSLFQNAEVA